MTQTYRTTDAGRWGTGKGSRLTPSEVDINFWDIIQRLVTLEAGSTTVTISSFEVVGSMFYVHLSDSTVLGPYKLPTATYRYRGSWMATTAYSVLDVFTNNGSLYQVLVDHTSALTFDPGANDGSGHDYYGLLLSTPGNALPTGGAPGQVMAKQLSADFSVLWRWIFPSGTGKIGWFLRQKSNTQDDVEWAKVDAAVVTIEPTTASGLTATTVEAAIEELAIGGGVKAAHVPYTPNTASGLTDVNVEDALNTLGHRSKVGRQTIWVPAASMSALLTNGATSATIETPTYKNLIKTMNFNKDTAQGAQFEIAMPKSWDKGNLEFKFYWSHPTTSVNFDVAWQMYANSISGAAGTLDANVNAHVDVLATGGVAESLYKSAETASLAVLDAATGLPPANAGDVIIAQVWRNAADVTDTLAVDARLHGVQVYYNTTSATDD